MRRLTYVFVHGLAGWGSYDEQYKRKPYWGMSGGDLMVFLKDKGFDCYAASVDPKGSAWDRACELYAQLAGARVDYGSAHSRNYKHDRYGRDFSTCPLIPSWNEETRLVLLGHSFGGATVRLFSELMAHGEEKERLSAGTGELSPFFAGGMEARIHSIVTLASPMNGTTAYDMFQDPSFDPDSVKVPWWSKVPANAMGRGLREHPDGRDPRDFASFDMHVDNSPEMNKRLMPLAATYYFSVPCSCTQKGADGNFKPKKIMEPLFVRRSTQIGAYSGRTRGGMVIDESWKENDGLVNTVSAMSPIGAPAVSLDRENIKPGCWNVFPTFDGDHMALQGGLMRKHDIKDFYLDLLTMIEPLG